ncbi:MAG: M50 family metallopeptidase [Candidatus Omnitrophica bacterium]|nr:M50 family metallopeptidase [Candidatus Omnitrophota bacterium]
MEADPFFIKALKFFAALSILIIIHEWGHFIAAVKAGVRVEVFSIGFGKKLFRRKTKNTEFAISAIPLGGYVKMAGDNLEEAAGKPDEFLSKPVSRRLAIIAAGPLMNYVFGILFLWAVFATGYPALGTRVGGLIDGMGAKAAGIAVNDTIIAIEGAPTASWDDLVSAIRKNDEKPAVSVRVRRGSDEIPFEVSLVALEKATLLGEKFSSRGIGISPAAADNRVIIRYPVTAALGVSVKRTLEMTVLTYKAFWYIAIGRLSARTSVGGPVAMFDWFGAVRTLNEFLLLLAAVSVGLAIFNLLPFPALDGGHILLLGIEKVRGRYLSKRSEEIFARVGYTVLITLAVLITANDLANRGALDRVTQAFHKISSVFNATAH